MSLAAVFKFDFISGGLESQKARDLDDAVQFMERVYDNLADATDLEVVNSLCSRLVRLMDKAHANMASPELLASHHAATQWATVHQMALVRFVFVFCSTESH